MTRAFNEQDIVAVDPAELTPAMRQYQAYKAQYPDAVLFFRMGDFYETFYEDARLIARVLGVALTSRSKGENPVPMAGVPFHAVETYLSRMIAAGYKVAICEQMQDAAEAKGVIDRQVTRLVTPGTLTDEAMLDGREENFLAAMVLDGRGKGGLGAGQRGASAAEAAGENSGGRAVQSPAALAWCDLSTGKFWTLEAPLSVCLDELARIRPREMLYADAADHHSPGWLVPVAEALKLTLTPRPAWQLEEHHGHKTLREHYGVLGFGGFGYEDQHSLALRAAGALVSYLHETQKASLEHLQPPRRFARADYLLIDPASVRSLEILRSIRHNTAEGSLVDAVDETQTPMGSRLLRNWLMFPLRDLRAINARLDAVSELLEREAARQQIRLLLASCGDVERITARICCRRAGPRDLMALSRSLDLVPVVAKILRESGAESPGLAGFDAHSNAAQKISDAIRAAVVEEPPGHLRDGGVIREGFNAELDRLRSLAHDSRNWLADYQAGLVKSTGISSLKVGYNKVFGYYIEVTHAHRDRIPPEFSRRQTVKNAERYVTPELQKFETDVLQAQERSRLLEQELFENLREELAGQAEPLKAVAAALAGLDVLGSIAHLARARHYCRPKLTLERELHLVEARHPVLEQVLGEKFVPNDVSFEPEQATLHLLTGPNMAGKSTYIRQTALLVLMAQAGFYLPAAEAVVGLVDRIFTRVGASDDLAGGQSTFMVEMTETANILHHASADSLVILDEIGRGTSTLDGLALAWAITEYLSDSVRCRTLFATHYHELTELPESTSAVRNFSVLVREWEDQIVFMHRIVAGHADRSYGVQVARLAGVPRSVIVRAKKLMEQLEVRVGKARPRAAATAVSSQIDLFETPSAQALSHLAALDLNRMSPMQAWEALKMLQAMLAETPAARAGGQQSTSPSVASGPWPAPTAP
jgi:DNA mismatch repair protein MutS